MAAKKATAKDTDYYASLPYTIILEQWDDGKGPYWVARVAELPHCLTHGDTPEDALKEIEKVKREWIQSNLQRGLTVPRPSHDVIDNAVADRRMEEPSRPLEDYVAEERSRRTRKTPFS